MLHMFVISDYFNIILLLYSIRVTAYKSIVYILYQLCALFVSQCSSHLYIYYSAYFVPGQYIHKWVFSAYEFGPSGHVSNVALAVTPAFILPNGGCVTMDYNRHGETQGMFNIYIRKEWQDDLVFSQQGELSHNSVHPELGVG